jgi:hypothetical protein
MADYKDQNLELRGYRLSDFDIGLGIGALVGALSDKPNTYTYQDRAALVRIAAFIRRTRNSDILFITTEDPIFFVFTRLLLPAPYSLEVKAGKDVKRSLKKHALIEDISKNIRLQVCSDIRDLFPDFEKITKNKRFILLLTGEHADLLEWGIRQGHKYPDTSLVLIRDYSLSKNPSAAPVTRELGGFIDERADGLGEYIP